MLALFLALASPELEVRGITASYGNTVVENAYRNTVEILRRAGRRLTLGVGARRPLKRPLATADRKSTRLNSSHSQISYAVFCLKKKKHRPCPPGHTRSPLRAH